MKKFDKSALLFEMLLTPDMVNVNKKIDEIRASEEYHRVSIFLPTASSPQILRDVKARFNEIDLTAITSMKQALEVEQEIIDLDRRLGKFPSINPYLANGDQKFYKIRTIGEIPVEVNAEGTVIDSVTAHPGLTVASRKKIVKGKVFNWYKEAKHCFEDSIDNSKIMVSKAKHSKIRFKSIGFQHFLLALAAIAFIGFALFSPTHANYRAGKLDTPIQFAHTAGIYVVLLCTLISDIIRTCYRTYPFRFTSKLRNKVIKQTALVNKLDKKSYYFENKIINNKKPSASIKTLVKKVSVMAHNSQANGGEVFEYVYSEKEYFYRHHKGALVLHCIVFALGFVVAVAGIFYSIVF